MKQQQLVIAGSGGQGVVVTGQLLAKAALLEGLNAVQTQSYGIAQRGGFCSAEVIVDADEILFQQVECPSVVVAPHGGRHRCGRAAGAQGGCACR